VFLPPFVPKTASNEAKETDMSRLPLYDVCGPVNDLIQKLSGEDGSQWLEYLNKMLSKQNPFNIPLANGLPNLDWRKVYGHLGISAQEYNREVSLLNISERDDCWTLPVLKILRKEKEKDILLVTPNRIFEAIECLGKKHGFKACRSQNNLDAEITVNARDPYIRGSYIIGFARAVEPDQKPQLMWYDKPEEFVASENTLLEELLLQLACFVTTGKHLTVKKVTRCGASRFSGGDVPGVSFRPDVREVCVDEWNPGDRYGHLRARSHSFCDCGVPQSGTEQS
jgi:hypothetical protein